MSLPSTHIYLNGRSVTRDDRVWLLSSAHDVDFCAMEWIDPKLLRRIDKGTQPELNGYVWWFCSETSPKGIPQLKKTMLCSEHSEQMLLEKFVSMGFFDDE